jgi:redox-sensitive bicupin YhaK (pirin superfamily)
MNEVIAGDAILQRPLLDHLSSIPLTLRRIFESEEVGLFHVSLKGTRRMPLGHDHLTCVVLSLEGAISLREEGRERTIDAGSYAVLAEGQVCDISAVEAGAEALLFIGLEQLPGAFFNSYGPADVQNG